MSAPTTASILIVNYNYGRYLSSSIDSALSQTWPNVQVVVVDDGSTDESSLIMQTYGSEIETVYKKNGGQASGANAAFPLLTGETVIFLDSDDLLEPDAIEKTIGFFEDPDIVKVCWPFTIIDRNGSPTGETKFRRISSGNFRRQALRMGPASHYTPAQSGNFWRKSFLDEVFPIHETDFRNIVDAYLFTFSPFFGSFRSVPEPLTRYRVHGSNISTNFSAVRRRDQWEARAKHLHPWLTERGEKVSIERWRKKNPYYQRLDGIAKAEARIGEFLPKGAPLALVAGPLYDRADMRPIRPVHRAPSKLLSPDRTEADFRAFLTELSATGIEHIAIQGPSTWNGTNLGALVDVLRSDHEFVFESDYIVIANIGSSFEDATTLQAEPKSMQTTS
jgi:glycosyltransferase involved in cell wall biosynthesis